MIFVEKLKNQLDSTNTPAGNNQQQKLGSNKDPKTFPHNYVYFSSLQFSFYFI